MLRTRKKTMKLILTSATLDEQILQDFFSPISKNIPVLEIP
jgi:HrpA-like RNA helicase